LDYKIEYLNPNSSYHLSVKINYPNKFDKMVARKEGRDNLGGDIFIHGDCVTIGCIPMTDDKIKEIYLYATYAKQTGQHKIPVYVYPFKMSSQNFETYSSFNNSNPELIKFWNNLKTGYDKFEDEKDELKVEVDNNGKYLF
jgi:murein L,D-transpeptidase YafK